MYNYFSLDRSPLLMTKVIIIFIAKVLNTWSRLQFRTFPYKLLSPVLKFRRDGWNERIYTSISPIDNANIVIFGGYLGLSTQDWLNIFPNATFDIFEPVPQYAEQIRQRFNSENIRLHPYGISEFAETREFRLLGDATFAEGSLRSTFKKKLPGVVIPVKFKSIVNLAALLSPKIYILEVNIEGGEYELLPLLSKSNLLTRVDHLFLQFHDVGKKTNELIESVRADLSKTHNLEWSYHLIWEYWRIQNPT